MNPRSDSRPRAQAKKMSSLKLLLVLSLFPTQGVSARRVRELAKVREASAATVEGVAQVAVQEFTPGQFWRPQGSQAEGWEAYQDPVEPNYWGMGQWGTAGEWTGGTKD